MPFPLEVRAPASAADPDALPGWLRDRRAALTRALAAEGALLFRGLPVADATDFDAFVRAFGWPAFPYAGSLSNAVRIERTERVFTANESPPEAEIRLHHELAQTPCFPRRLFFFCERPADAGGATPICRSDLLLDALARSRPDFVRDCETHGLVYSLVMPPEDDPGSGQGRSWRSTFSCESRGEAEARLGALGYRFTWLPGDCLCATTPVLPGVRELPPGRRTFFNQLIATLAWTDARNDDARSVVHGDGRPIDLDAVREAGEIAESLCVDLAWRRGDVALIDNFSVMHGRRSFRGPRVVLASLSA